MYILNIRYIFVSEIKTNNMKTQKFIFTTIQEVQTKQAELKAIYGSDNVMKCLNHDVYYYVTFNIFS